jgi:hypothetical protein
MSDFTLKTNHVNSKRIFNDVSVFVEEIIHNFNIMWSSDSQRDAILEVLDEHMEDLVEANKIEQWNVICDGRNNKASDIKNKITHLDISYRQRNCFNVTELKYTIKEK